MDKFCRTFKNLELFSRIGRMSPAAAKIFGYVVEGCDWRLGRCVASIAEISAALELSDRSVKRANKELADNDLVKYQRGIYAINPDFVWGGRSWNRPKASYYTMNTKTAQVINFADAAQALNEEALERAGQETLREISARKRKGNKTC